MMKSKWLQHDIQEMQSQASCTRLLTSRILQGLIRGIFDLHSDLALPEVNL